MVLCIRTVIKSQRPPEGAFPSKGNASHKHKWPSPLRLLLLALLFLAASCDGQGAQTAGVPIRFALRAEGETPTSGGNLIGPFDAAGGWQVHLERAELAMGPIYLYQGLPPTGAYARLKELLWIKRAQACPADAQYDAGLILGEVNLQYRVDLLNPDGTDLGTVSGIAGTIREAELHLHPPGKLAEGRPGDLAPLDGSTLVIQGVASKDDRQLPFSVQLTIPETGTMRIVPQIPTDISPIHIDRAPDDNLTIRILVDKLFVNADFAQLATEHPEAGEEDRLHIDQDTQVWVALLHSIRSRHTYQIEWRSN